VQGRLRKEIVEIKITTACAHCGRGLNIHLDSDMNARVEESGAAPLYFEPQIDWRTFTERTIIDAY
jgi:hypothetical protein